MEKIYECIEVCSSLVAEVGHLVPGVGDEEALQQIQQLLTQAHDIALQHSNHEQAG